MDKQTKAGLYLVVPDPDSEKKQRKYAAMCRGRAVLELGGVKGSFIDLCVEAGAKSVTSIDRMPLDKRVQKADIIKFLKTTKKKFDAVYARHLLEHFSQENVVLMMKNAYRCLNRDGIFIIVGPNMNNIAMATNEFWREFEHVRPYTVVGLCQNLERAGFKIIAAKPDEDSWDSNPLKKIVRAIRSLIVGIPYEAPDMYIIAEKP
jgi:cyclopropane fatty-acyl-phospholipid synthase-like methyltransferase